MRHKVSQIATHYVTFCKMHNFFTIYKGQCSYEINPIIEFQIILVWINNRTCYNDSIHHLWYINLNILTNQIIVTLLRINILWFHLSFIYTLTKWIYVTFNIVNGWIIVINIFGTKSMLNELNYIVKLYKFY